jgi:hypothetical protein
MVTPGSQDVELMACQHWCRYSCTSVWTVVNSDVDMSAYVHYGWRFGHISMHTRTGVGQKFDCARSSTCVCLRLRNLFVLSFLLYVRCARPTLALCARGGCSVPSLLIFFCSSFSFAWRYVFLYISNTNMFRVDCVWHAFQVHGIVHVSS